MTTQKYVEVRDLSNQDLICKALFSHSWDENHAAELPSPPKGRAAHRVLALRCTRCHTERFDYLNRSGELNGRYYRRPETAQSIHRTPIAELRLALISRSLLVLSVRSNGRKGTN